jgi:hypothetical protein
VSSQSQKSSILVATATQYFVLGANAHNRLWNSAKADSRGLDLEFLLHSIKLSVAKAPTKSLDFVPTSTSFVDVTLYSDQVDIDSCFFLSAPSLSDLTYIFCFVNIDSPEPSITRRQSVLRIPKLSSVYRSFFTDTYNVFQKKSNDGPLWTISQPPVRRKV